MQCTNCGAEIQPGATVCPSCEARVVLGKPSAAPRRRLGGFAPRPASRPEPASALKAEAAPAPRPAAPAPRPAARPAAESAPKAPKPPKPARAPKVRDASEPPAWVKPAVIAVAALILLAGGWFVYSILTAGPNTADAAALRFMQAYASYDARGMLDNSTHASFTATDLATFEHDMAGATADEKAHPIYTDIKVVSVTIEQTDPNVAIVKLSANMLDSVSTPSNTTSTVSPGTYSPRDETLTVVKSSSGKWLVKWN